MTWTMVAIAIAFFVGATCGALAMALCVMAKGVVDAPGGDQ